MSTIESCYFQEPTELICKLQIGDAIMICDAGGENVDLVSYQIVSLHPLQFNQLVPGTGTAFSFLLWHPTLEVLTWRL
jgi:hypothetical protein